MDKTPQYGFLFAGKIVSLILGVGEKQIDRQRLVVEVIDYSRPTPLASSRQGNPELPKTSRAWNEITHLRARCQKIGDCFPLILAHELFSARKVGLRLDDGVQWLGHVSNMPQRDTLRKLISISEVIIKRSFRNVAERLFRRLGFQGLRGIGQKAGFFG